MSNKLAMCNKMEYILIIEYNIKAFYVLDFCLYLQTLCTHDFIYRMVKKYTA
jgi:hypothetical protein